MKKIVFMIFLISASMLGQELPDVLPQSPEAASIGKYGQVPIGLFTGTPQLSIPIYQFKSGALSLPISLNYSSNGIRVDEYASSVGLGWNLSAGGVITRSVYGKKDENQYRPAKNVNIAVGEERFFYASAAANPSPNGIDIQPDIFSFNFNGYSGKFYLDDNSSEFYHRNVVFLEPSPLKIELSHVNHESNFKITDPTGVIYYFGGTNAIEKFRYNATNQSNDGGQQNPLVPSAWYLTKIVHPSGEEITLTYDRGSVIYKNGIAQSVTKVDRFSIDSSPCMPNSSDRAYLTIAQGYFAYLSEISSTVSGTVNFSYSQKTAMPNEFKKLDKITIKDINNNTIKSFDLTYQMAEATGPKNNHITQETYYDKRYFLSTVTEKSAEDIALSPYRLIYNNPEGLPSRFSYAQDYWGFYNGNTLNQNLIDQKIINKVSSNFVLGNALNTFKGADRNPSPEHAELGMLTSITYPTKGKNEFIYEGHAYWGSVTQDPTYTAKSIEVNPSNLSSSFDIQNILYDHKGKLSFGANIDDFFQAVDDPVNDLDFNIAEVNIYDITSGVEVPENFYDESDIHGWRPISATAYGITNRNFQKKLYIKLKEGHSYRFKIQLHPQYTLSSLNLKYFNQLPIITTENISVGGLRIAQVKTLNGEGKTENKSYHYGRMDCLDCDSGTIISRNIEPSVTSFETLFCLPNTSGTQWCQVASCGTTTISSNTTFSLYGMQGYHIGYKSVVEEFGNNFKSGALEHLFEGDFTIAPNLAVFGDYIPGLPYSNFFGFGREKQQSWYAKKDGNHFTKVQEVKNLYKHKLNLDKETPIYSVRRAAVFLPNVTFVDDPNYSFQNVQFHTGQYSLFRQWHVLDKKITKQYDANGENRLTTTVSYFYDNEQHLQRTRTETVDSNGHILKTRTLFPQDISNPLPVHQQLIDQHQIAVPIQVENYRKEGVTEELISSQHTLFKDWGNNLILPEAVQTLKGAQSATNTLEDRIEYLDYDTKGNPLEVSKTDGAHIIYIWGYNDQYPIAKITNATYTGMPIAVINLIDQIKTATNTENSNVEESTIRELFDNLRDHDYFKDSEITSYTYDPLIGATSITDPRGYTVYYEYDIHNRLQFVKDEEGKLISENTYNYKQ